MFVLRQVDSKINTTTFSMSIISILLFLTICIFSSAVSLNDMLTNQLREYTPVDASFVKNSDLKEGSKDVMGYLHTKDEIESSKKGIEETLSEAGFSINDNFSQVVNTYCYKTEQLLWEDSFKPIENEIKEKYPMLRMDSKEAIMKISEYNKIAKMYGKQEMTLGKDEFIVIANYKEFVEIRKKALEKGLTITLDGKEYKSKYKECKDGFINNFSQAFEQGIYLLPDEAVKDDWDKMEYLNVNYKGTTDKEKETVEKKLENLTNNGGAVNVLEIANMSAYTQKSLYDASKGLSATVTFIGLYLGIIFLISSSAILALKELSDSSDNKERYEVLRKIGTDEKMINKALFKQIGIFYLIPLGLAIIHSIFGLKVASIILSMFGKQEIMTSIIVTALFIILIYGGYFLATYLGSKNIIKEE